MTYDYELRRQEAGVVRVRHDTLCDECLVGWTRDGWKAEPLRQVDSHRRVCRLCGACNPGTRRKPPSLNLSQASLRRI